MKDGKAEYQLNVNSCTDTEVVATLGGGHVGDFTIRVNKIGYGSSMGTVDFSYIINLASVTP